MAATSFPWSFFFPFPGGGGTLNYSSHLSLIWNLPDSGRHMTSPSLSFSLPLHGKGKKRDPGNEVGLEDRQTATHSLLTLIRTPGPRQDWVLKQLVKKHFMYALHLTLLGRPRHYVVVFCRWVLKVVCTNNIWELKQWQRRWQRWRHLKMGFGVSAIISRSFQVNCLAKCVPTILELNWYGRFGD